MGVCFGKQKTCLLRQPPSAVLEAAVDGMFGHSMPDGTRARTPHQWIPFLVLSQLTGIWGDMALCQQLSDIFVRVVLIEGDVVCWKDVGKGRQ